MMMKIRSTTILGVRRGDAVAMAGDGQVTLGAQIMKGGARKVRRIYKDRILVGFAGSSADALTLFERLEGKLEAHSGNLSRAAVELARDWRGDKVLRRLEALLAAMDRKNSFLISGAGEVIEPDDGLIGIGSGGGYAIAAARAFLEGGDLPPAEIAERSLRIAAGLCIYTNDRIVVEELS